MNFLAVTFDEPEEARAFVEALRLPLARRARCAGIHRPHAREAISDDGAVRCRRPAAGHHEGRGARRAGGGQRGAAADALGGRPAAQTASASTAVPAMRWQGKPTEIHDCDAKITGRGHCRQPLRPRRPARANWRSSKRDPAGLAAAAAQGRAARAHGEGLEAFLRDAGDGRSSCAQDLAEARRAKESRATKTRSRSRPRSSCPPSIARCTSTRVYARFVARGGHGSSVPRAPDAVLDQPLRGVGGQDRGAGPRRRDGARGHPPACAPGTSRTCCWPSRSIRRCCCISTTRLPSARTRSAGAVRRAPRQRAARSTSTRTWRAKSSSCTRSAWTAATRRPTSPRSRRPSPAGRSAARTTAAASRRWASTTASPANSSSARSSTSPARSKLLGKSYGEDGVRQGEAILRDLAHAPRDRAACLHRSSRGISSPTIRRRRRSSA